MPMYRKTKLPKNSLYRASKDTYKDWTGRVYRNYQVGLSGTFSPANTAGLRDRYSTEQWKDMYVSDNLIPCLPAAFLEGK